MERSNGELRDREKVMRSLKTEETPILKGMQSFHNYLRPHMGLDGRTPAQTAGLDLGLDGIRWKELIKQATTGKRP